VISTIKIWKEDLETPINPWKIDNRWINSNINRKLVWSTPFSTHKLTRKPINPRRGLLAVSKSGYGKISPLHAWLRIWLKTAKRKIAIIKRWTEQASILGSFWLNLYRLTWKRKIKIICQRGWQKLSKSGNDNKWIGINLNKSTFGAEINIATDPRISIIPRQIQGLEDVLRVRSKILANCNGSKTGALRWNRCLSIL
jgi:hypothetical protein